MLASPMTLRTLRFPVASVLTAALAATSLTARADETNRNLFPVGDREAFMANTGITSPSAGAVFYNPANLARLGTPTLAMTGTTLMRFDLSTDALLVIDAEDQPFNASGFLTIPTSIVSTYEVGNWHLATSILVPDAIELTNQLSFESPLVQGTIVFRESQQDLWLGASAARAVGERGTVGVSLFGVQRTQAQFQVLNITSDAGAALQTTENLEASLIGATAVVGGHWQVTDTVGVGARFQTPLVNVSSSASDYLSTLTADGDSVTFTETSLEGLDYERPMPWDVGVGVSVRASPAIELVADVNVQLPATFRRLPGDDETELETALRASVGADFDLPGSLRAQVGGLYNGSASPEPAREGDAREDYWGATGGLSWRSGRTRTGLGLFFHQSFGELLPSGLGDGNERRVDIRTRLFGALITVDYSL